MPTSQSAAKPYQPSPKNQIIQQKKNVICTAKTMTALSAEAVPMVFSRISAKPKPMRNSRIVHAIGNTMRGGVSAGFAICSKRSRPSRVSQLESTPAARLNAIQNTAFFQNFGAHYTAVCMELCILSDKPEFVGSAVARLLKVQSRSQAECHKRTPLAADLCSGLVRYPEY